MLIKKSGITALKQLDILVPIKWRDFLFFRCIRRRINCHVIDKDERRTKIDEAKKFKRRDQ